MRGIGLIRCRMALRSSRGARGIGITGCSQLMPMIQRLTIFHLVVVGSKVHGQVVPKNSTSLTSGRVGRSSQFFIDRSRPGGLLFVPNCSASSARQVVLGRRTRTGVHHRLKALCSRLRTLLSMHERR